MLLVGVGVLMLLTSGRVEPLVVGSGQPGREFALTGEYRNGEWALYGTPATDTPTVTCRDSQAKVSTALINPNRIVIEGRTYSKFADVLSEWQHGETITCVTDDFTEVVAAMDRGRARLLVGILAMVAASFFGLWSVVLFVATRFATPR